MEKSALYLEIFGGDGLDEIKPAQKPVPSVPVLDDPLRDFIKSDGAAAGLCKQLEMDAMTAQLVGDTFDLAGEVFTPSTLKIIGGRPARTEPDIGNFLKNAVHFTMRAARLDKSEPRRKRELREIVDSTLGQYIADHHPNRISDPFLKSDLDECFSRITDSMYAFTRESLMGAA